MEDRNIYLYSIGGSSHPLGAFYSEEDARYFAEYEFADKNPHIDTIPLWALSGP